MRPFLLALICCFCVGNSALAQDLSGVWRGKWTAAATPRLGEHSGSLRIRLMKQSTNSYQGRFTGRFALVIPYFYRANVTQYGNRLYSEKRLGPFGSYHMTLQSSGNSMAGTWNTKGHRGTIFVQRRR